MNPIIRTLLFPLVMACSISGAIMLPIGLFVVNLYKSFRAIPKVMRDLYSESEV